MKRSSSSSCVCSSRLIWSRTSARCRSIASAWRWASWCSRSASGVSETSDRSRASSAASARCPSCSSDTDSSSRSCLRRAPTSARRRSTSDRDIGGSVRGEGFRTDLRRCPMARCPRRPPCALALVATLGLGVAGCGGDGGGDACGPTTREALDPAYLVHVLGDDQSVEYTSDPPTSGPHMPSPPVEGVLDEPLSPALQVGVLERGDVLVQHDPDLAADDRADLEELAGSGVVVA